MARKFKLSEKPCKVGKRFTGSGEGEGEQREDLVKFSLTDLMLTAKDLDKNLGPDAAAHLFIRKGSVDAVEPRFGDDINEFALAHRYVDSTVTLSLDGETLTLAGAKIMGVVLQPQVGGMTWMACDIEAPAVDGVDAIRKHGGLKIAAQLSFGQKPELDKRQKSLALNEGEDADDEGDDTPPAPKKGNGSRPHA